MISTQVINLFGGSGLGKSTTAAGLFYEMKLRGLHCELIREYVKQWAWDGTKIGPFDQVYIFGKQAKTESRLYGKVEFAVTDSPLLLSPIYESFYTGDSVVSEAALKFLRKAADTGVQHHNFILERHKPFDTRGRYETEETARKVDEHVKAKLTDWGVPYTIISAPDRERVAEILGTVLA
jgi:hypothetical protein